MLLTTQRLRALFFNGAWAGNWRTSCGQRGHGRRGQGGYEGEQKFLRYCWRLRTRTQRSTCSGRGFAGWGPPFTRWGPQQWGQLKELKSGQVSWWLKGWVDMRANYMTIWQTTWQSAWGLPTLMLCITRTSQAKQGEGRGGGQDTCNVSICSQYETKYLTITAFRLT